eukprot:jgi/Galph1/3268/GphlegSOOS_G1912.1
MSQPPIGTFLQGIVKEVHSGDTLGIIRAGPLPKTGPPPELRLTLVSVSAPRFSLKAKRANVGDSASEQTPTEQSTHVDLEPYAWDSREFLRQLVIGKPVIFRVDYKADNTSERFFGTVYLSDKTCLNHLLVKKGTVKVRKPNSPNDKKTVDLEALLKLEEEAISAGLGIHGSLTSLQPVKVTRTPFPADNTLTLSKIFGIVEQVITGSSFRIMFPEDLEDARKSHISSNNSYRLVVVSLSGVQSPGFKFETISTETKVIPQPFALNAKLLSEQRLLNRVVEVKVHTIDKNGSIIGEVERFVTGDELAENYVGEDLLRAGLARRVTWGMELSSRSTKLSSAEKRAIEERLGIWQSYVPSPNAPTALADTFTAKVIEIVAADTIVVKPEGSKETRRLSFSSLKGPRMGKSREMDTMVAFEAREFLRKLILGKLAKVEMDYNESLIMVSEWFVYRLVFNIIFLGTNEGTFNTIEFATVSLYGNDVGEMLVCNGFANVIRHKSDEERARHYEKYIALEKEAIAAKKGIHGATQQGNSRRVNNLSVKEATKRAKETFPHLQRSGSCAGIVEYVSNGSRYKILLPKESTIVSFALEYVRCPHPTNDVFGQEALQFARENILQRDVQVSFTTIDRIGTFIGKLKIVERMDKGEYEWEKTLLEHGLGYINESVQGRAPNILKEVQRQAEKEQRGIWSVPTEQATFSETDSINMVGVVSEVSGGGRLYIQAEEEQTYQLLKSLEEQLQEMSLKEERHNIPFSSLKLGSKIAAKYSLDSQWYRGVIIEKNASEDKVLVHFMDYGNQEWVSSNDITSLPINLQNSPCVAYCVIIKDIVVPHLDEEYGVDAGEFLREMVWGKQLRVKAHMTESSNMMNRTMIGDVYVIWENMETNVASELLRQGLARIVRRKDATSRAAFERYGEDEEIGRQSRRFLWKFGDAYASDEDSESLSLHKPKKR